MAPPGFTSSKKAGPPAPPGKSATDIGRELDREITRREYFKGRPDISDDRLDRRLKQAQELAKFKREETKPVYTTSGSIVKGLTQRRTPESMDLAQKQMQLANKYGPTLSEIGSDFAYGLGQFGSALGDRLQQGSIGLLGIVKNIANYALDKANKGYEKLNSVQQEIFDNPNKYPYASKIAPVEAVNNSKELALQADRDALGLELDALMAQREEDRFRYENPTVDMRRPTEEELAPMDIGYVESGQFKSDLEKSGILTVDDPATGEPLADSTKIPGTDTTLGDLKEELKKRNYNDFQITGIINEMTQRIISGEDVNAPIENIGEPEATYPNAPGGRDEEFYIDPLDMGTGPGYSRFIGGSIIDKSPYLADTQYGMKSLEYDDILEGDSSGGTQVTAYNNPGNLQFAGQPDAIEGQTYGNNFAVFPNAEAGINALRADLTAKVNRNNAVDKIIGEYAPKEDNPESFNNYLSFVKERVGETVEPNEIDDLTRSIIQFENKPDIANKYLTMVADGGMIDKQLKSLQNGLQNMYNGIPSVRRR